MKTIQVTCAIILHQNKFLAAKRSSTMPHPGYWEFPGGKLEKGEKAEACIIREIQEELNCTVHIQKALPVFTYAYTDKTVELLPFVCKLLNTKPTPIEHQEIKWLESKELNCVKWLPADIAIKDYLLNNF